MINIISPINQLGYGIASLNIIKNIEDISLWPIGQVQVTNEQDANIIRKALKNALLPDFNAPCIRIWHQHDMSQFVGNGQKIGFPFFELNKFTKIEKHHLGWLDKIFVTSNWAKNIILDQVNFSSENIYVVPLGVDCDIFQTSNNSNPDKTIFFNCGKWEIRKGHDILIKAFNLAFNKNDNVELWMMCDNPFLNEQQSKDWVNLYKNSNLGEKITIINRKNTQGEVYNIMAQTDCGVFPARAEGWNLELLEMMSCGKSVIATNYSAHTEFCNHNNSRLINITELEPAFDGIWFHGDGEWAKFSQNQIDQLISHMREIHTLKMSGNLTTDINAKETANKFTWKQTSEMVKKHV